MNVNSNQEFNKRLYNWCESELAQEFNNNFYYTRRVKNKYNFSLFNTLQTFSIEERDLVLKAILKKGIFGSKFLITEFEESYLEDVRKKCLMESIKNIEYFFPLYKKFTIKEVKKAIIDIFNKNVIPNLPNLILTFKSNHLLVYEIKINSWIIETAINIDKGGYGYNQKIRSDTSRAVLCKTGFPGLVGFSGGWCFFNKEDIYEAANDIAYHSLRFIEALPQMLEDILVPDLSPPERNTSSINPEKLIQNAKKVIEINRAKIASALDSQNPIDEMLELGIVMIEQGYTWDEVAVIFDVIGNFLDDTEDFGDRVEIMVKISNEWHKRKVILSE